MEWTNKLSGRAEKRFWRYWDTLPPKRREESRWFLRNADTLARKTDEGTKYLLVANGAVLVAAISQIGAAGKEPALRQALVTVISGFTISLLIAIVTWIAGALSVRNLMAYKAEALDHGYTRQVRKLRRDYHSAATLFLVLIALDLTIFAYYGTSFAAHLK